ncbi:MAG: 4-hydroxy-3-methylbut-2-enyl diphosphate reductase [Verrucomicrobiota bacterium]
MPESATTEPKTKKKRVNVRRPDVMEKVQAEVENHYRSSIVEKVRARGGHLTIGNTTIRLAQQFGFCYGVERAIDLAYAARRVFKDRNIYLIGEIIHNPEVNRHLRDMNIKNVTGKNADIELEDLQEDDVVIVPAFGAETAIMDVLKEKGCDVVDTTCGDVMRVWRRVKHNAKHGSTSIIHGKAQHEETLATASRAMGDGSGHFLIVLTLDDVDFVCDYIRNGGDRQAFLDRFEEGYSEGFDPDLHLKRIGVANQTTMLKGETEEIQRRLQRAVLDRDGEEVAKENFNSFDTICGATQERQDALYEMLGKKMDVLLVVGGYNSSNTTHLVEIGEKEVPSFFIGNAECLESLGEIVHFDLERKEEVKSYTTSFSNPDEPVVVGITAGASCPNNLIEETILRVFALRGIDSDEVRAS